MEISVAKRASIPDGTGINSIITVSQKILSPGPKILFLRACLIIQNIRRFAPDCHAARRGGRRVSMEWLSPTDTTLRRANLGRNPLEAASPLALNGVGLLGQGPPGIGTTRPPGSEP